LPDHTRFMTSRPFAVLITALALIPAPGVLRGAEPTAPAKALASAGVALRRIVVAESLEQAEALAREETEEFLLLAPELAFINRQELDKRMKTGRGLIISDGLLVGINQILESVVRSTENPVATSMIPAQSIDKGIVRVVLTLGRFREIKFTGNRWSSEAQLRQKLGLGAGGTIRMSQLDQAIAQANSPFRNLRARIDPIANSTEANLTIAVQEKLPVRVWGMADTSGNEILGKNRLVAGVSHANLWGRDHTLTYQHITSDRFRVTSGHSLDYVVPLARQRSLSFSANYLRSSPTFLNGLFAQDGKNLGADIRFNSPLMLGGHSWEGTLATSFRQTNNNLEFGGESVLANSLQILHLQATAATVFRDPRGAWGVSVSATVSPGNLMPRNTTTDFEMSRSGAKANYLVGNLTLQRLQKLGGEWELFLRGTAQRSTSNLISGEQLSMGGAMTVRGYRENTAMGDRGVFVSGELGSPVWRRSSATKFGVNEMKGLAFVDFASVAVEQRQLREPPLPRLASLGLGVRLRFANNWGLQADYGWRMLKVQTDPDGGRGHVKVSFAY
jgi:hemolysin activation/secretion protein